MTAPKQRVAWLVLKLLAFVALTAAYWGLVLLWSQSPTYNPQVDGFGVLLGYPMLLAWLSNITTPESQTVVDKFGRRVTYWRNGRIEYNAADTIRAYLDRHPKSPWPQKEAKRGK